MIEVENLAVLKTLAFGGLPADDGIELRYVKGHTNVGDGGGGVFMWRTLPIFTSGIYSNDNNGTIIQAVIGGSPNNDGRWIRQYEGDINVLYFGAFGVGNDYTAEFENAIYFAQLNSMINPTLKGSTIFIPNGSYVIKNILLRNGISIVGESMADTILYCGEGGDYMFEMEVGVVTVNVSNLNLSGQYSSKGAFHFKSDATSGNIGGLTNSRISNILVFGFRGHGIYLEGGGDKSEYLLPNQFNIFENVRIFRASNECNSLRMTGQQGQFTFLNCEFDGFHEGNVYAKGVNIFIENVLKYTSAVVSFINCTCQDADYGIVIRWAENITIDNCWFENLGVAISVASQYADEVNDIPCKSINILNNRFANAAGFGSLEAPSNIKDGQCVNVSRSFVNVNNNYVCVTKTDGEFLHPDSAFIIAYNNITGGVYAVGNTYQVEKLGRTFGIMQVLEIQPDASLDCSGHRLVFARRTKSNDTIKVLRSFINAAEHLTIRADQDSIRFVNSDNIFFLTPNPGQDFVLNNGEIATFIKIDNIVSGYNETYQLVSILRQVI